MNDAQRSGRRAGVGLTTRFQDLVFRILAHPLRLLSLRSIVILAQLGVIILVLTLGVWVWVGVSTDQYDQLDQRLDSLSSLGDVNTLLRSAQDGIGPEPTEGGLVRTARIGSTTVSIPADIVLPELAAGYADTSIGGVEYRVRTITTGSASIALGAPLADTQARIDSLHWRVFWICAGVIVGTLLVGWATGHRRVTDRAEQDRVVSLQLGQHRVGQHVPGRMVLPGAEVVLGLLHAGQHSVEHLERLADDFRADAVAGDHRQLHWGPHDRSTSSSVTALTSRPMADCTSAGTWRSNRRMIVAPSPSAS